MIGTLEEIEGSVIRSVRQVVAGTHYEGFVTLANVVLAFEMKFALPLHQLIQTTPPEDEHELRDRIQIDIKKGGQKIEINDDEYFFFFKLLIDFVIDFYSDPMKKCFTLATMEEGFIQLPPDERAMLQASKFGCVFTIAR